MYKKIIMPFVAATMVTGAATTADAETYKCPQKVAYAYASLFADEVVKVYKDVYQALGCETEFVALPAKRITASFRNGEVDGDVYRFDIIEKSYDFDFTRSLVPLFYVSTYLYQRENSQSDGAQRYGYMRGVKWQEGYAAKHENGMPFYNEKKLFDKYERGQLDRFLSGAFRVNYRIQTGEFQEQPVPVERVLRKPLWHYLHGDFKPFMNAFSSYITKHESFAGIEKLAD